MEVLGLLHVGQHSEPANRWDQAGHDLLSHVLGRGPQQVLKLDGAELLDDCGLLGDAVLEAGFKFIELALLLVKILDQSSASLLHLIQSALETHPVWSLVSLTMLDLVICDWVLGVPHVVSDEFFDLNLPAWLQIVVIDSFDFIHETLDVLDQDIVSRDQDSLLLARET